MWELGQGGSGLARDAGNALQLSGRVDAIAGKPAPTQASSYIDRVPGLFFGAVHHHQQLRLHLAHRADPVGLLRIEVQRITAL